jgi:hypothetical protein
VTPWKLMTQERIARRRNGCMPSDIRREFTRCQAAVMRVVLDQIIRDPEARCTLLHSHIAILSAMSTTTVHNTLRKAKALGLVQVTNSTRASHITVVSPELRAWLQNAFEEQEGRAKGR